MSLCSLKKAHEKQLWFLILALGIIRFDFITLTAIHHQSGSTVAVADGESTA